MILYMKLFKTFLIIVVFLLLIPLIMAIGEDSDKLTPTKSGFVVNSDQASQLASSGGEADIQQQVTFTTPHDSEVSAEAGTHLSSDGQNVVLDSKDEVKEDTNTYSNVEKLTLSENSVTVDKADSLQSGNVQATGITDFSQTKSTGSFDVQHADAITFESDGGTTTLTNVDNLNYFNDNVEFDHADYIQTNDFEAINIDQFSLDANKFTTKKADTLTSDCLELSNIKDSEFIIDSTKVFAKTNKLNIKDCLDNNITFEGNSIIASKDLPQSFSVSKGTLTAEFNNHTSILTTNSTSAATINEYGFTTIEMKSSSYTEKSNIKNKDFSIGAEKFLLFLRNHESENDLDISYCDNCGFVDKIINKIELKGKVTYKRRNQLLMPVYESFGNNHAELFLDENNIMIELFLLHGEDDANIYNNNFHIDEKDGVARVYYTEQHPNFIMEYFADINPKHRPILFNNNYLTFDPDNPYRTIITTEDLQEYEIEKCE
jgi:hypothetical protein